MSWHFGTASDYQDLLSKLVAFCTEDVVDTIAINAGGTGYILGEVLTIVGGTSVVPAAFRVHALGVSAAAIQVGGTGYTAADVLTVVGGDGTACTITVDTVSGGVITAVSMLTPGDYTDIPTDPVAVTGGTGNDDATFNLTSDIVTQVKFNNAGAYTSDPSSPASTTTDGAGTGCTLTLTMTTGNGWTIMRDTTPSGEKEVILRGDGSGSDEIYIGVKTYNVDDSYNWELAGMTGYVGAADWDVQPDISPGRNELLQKGAYVPLANTPMDYWITVSPYRVMGVVKAGSAYPNFHMGLLNPFATAAEMPYPIWICGCTDQHDLKFSETPVNYSGLTDPGSASSGEYPSSGLSFFRLPTGTWVQFRNHYKGSSPPRNQVQGRVVQPCGNNYCVNAGSGKIPYPEDIWFVDWQWATIVPQYSVPGTPTYQFRPTPDDDGERPLFPAQLVETYPGRFFVGQVDGLYWFHAAGTVTTEQTIEIGNDVYRIFQNCNRSEDFSYFCIKEE